MKHAKRTNNQAIRKMQSVAMASIYQTFEECQAIFDHAQRVSRAEVPESTDDCMDFEMATYDFSDR